jgi:glycosyltransferase involved in cell wall biosynthesis
VDATIEVDAPEHLDGAHIIASDGDIREPVASLLFVTGTPASVRGGSGTYVGISVLRQALQDAGNRVDLIDPGKAATGTLSRLLFNVRARRAARRTRFDAVVGFDLDGLYVSAPGTLRVASIKGVISDELRFERGLTKIAMRTASRFEAIHVRRADRVLTTSSYAADRIAANYGIARETIRVVPEPIDLVRWQSALGRAPRGAPPEPVILCVAHLYPRKQVASLLRAMALLKSPARLRVVGTGPELPALRELSRGLGLDARVDLLGHVTFEQLAAEYRGADIFCLPSLQEGFGIVFLEAMAAGLPVVACQAAAVPEVVPDWECGLLVPPRDVPALAFALDRLIEDEPERRRLGGAGRRRVARYDAPIVAAEFLEAIGLDGSAGARG